MIVDDCNSRFADAMAGTSADDIDLTWNITIGAPLAPNGRRAILCQLVLSCQSPVLGQRLWHVLDADINVFNASAEGLHKFAFDLVQTMLALRQQALNP